MYVAIALSYIRPENCLGNLLKIVGHAMYLAFRNEKPLTSHARYSWIYDYLILQTDSLNF